MAGRVAHYLLEGGSLDPGPGWMKTLAEGHPLQRLATKRDVPEAHHQLRLGEFHGDLGIFKQSTWLSVWQILRALPHCSSALWLICAIRGTDKAKRWPGCCLCLYEGPSWDSGPIAV